MKRPSILILLFCFACGLFPAAAQESFFKPFTSFRVITTERFDIIFPEESEPTARLLAARADRIYGEISSRLGIEVPGRIPVAISPHTDVFNGFYSTSPFPHIMLYDTPANPEWTTFANNLEGLFLHELTHAVSRSSRGPFSRGLYRIFGNWVYPTMINAPLFMVEGVTVSFESLSGFGRANDPLVKQKLRQALFEDKFLTPFQASGVYDLPGQESNYYEYGGLFSAWLQKTYGMEKYAELWQAMGKSFYFSFFVYRSGFYHFFKTVYGFDFIDAWNSFASNFDPGNLEINSEDLLPEKYRFFSRKETFIQSLKALGDELYFIDKTAGKIRAYNVQTGEERAFDSDSSYEINVSPDGSTLLGSAYRYAGERAEAVVIEYDAASGKKTGRTIQGLYKAGYFRDGVIGIRSELHNNCVVYEDFDGSREVLFRGNEGLQFSGPQSLDGERIVCIAVREGRRELWLYNYITRELFRIESVPGGKDHWLYMRDLGVSDGKVFFSHNAGDRMYKLARVDLDAMSAVFSKREFSGGVSSPVFAAGSVYYRGAFFSRDGLLRFPEAAEALSGDSREIKLIPLDLSTYEAAGERAGTQERDKPPLPEETVAGTAEALTPAANPASGETKPYIALRYMNPLQFWIPQPLMRETDANVLGLSLDGGGILSIMGDPTHRNLITLEAYADIRYRMAGVAQLSWQNTALGFPLALDFSDSVDTSGKAPRRVTGAALTGSLARSTGERADSLFLRGGYRRIAGSDGGKSAYEWENDSSYFYLQTGITLSGLRRRQHEMFGTGAVLSLGAESFLHRFEPRVDGIFQLNAETRFPLRLSLFGSYDNGGMNLRGSSNNYAGTQSAATSMREYFRPSELDITWLAGAELAAGLFSFEIQKNLSHAYFNRVSGILALRNKLYDGQGNPGAEGIAIHNFRLAQSLLLRLGMKTTVFPAVKVPLSVEPYISAYWKFSNTITGKGNPLYITAGMSVSY